MNNMLDDQQMNMLEQAVENTTEETDVVEAPVEAAPKKARIRSHKYVEARSNVDRTIAYPLDQAVELVKSTSYSKFDGTVTAHINLKKEMKPFDVSMPFSTGQTLRVAIANDEVLAALQEGRIEFDVLLAKPDMMGKLAKFARLLGPKGLMPNPKNGTVTSDPEAKRNSLLGGAMTVKPERKAPLLHVRLGKVSQPSTELAANLEALVKALGTNVTKVTLAATMSPGVKVNIQIA